MQTSVPYNSQAQDSPISSKLRAQEEPVDMTLEHSARERLAEAYENTVEKTRVTIHPSPLPILRDIKHRKTRSSKSGSTNSSRKNSLFFKEEKAPTAESPVNASTFATEIFPSDDDNARVTAVAIDPAPETVAADTDRPETPAAVEECMHELPITTASVMPDATVSPETQAKAGVSNKREKSTQDGVSHKREKSTQDGVSHKREKSTQDGVSHKREKSMQDGVSHTREKSMQDGVSHKREKSTQDGVSHKREKSTQDGVSHKREKSTQDGVSHKREKSTQDGESHKREKSTEGGPALSHPKKSHRFGLDLKKNQEKKKAEQRISWRERLQRFQCWKSQNSGKKEVWLKIFVDGSRVKIEKTQTAFEYLLEQLRVDCLWTINGTTAVAVSQVENLQPKQRYVSFNPVIHLSGSRLSAPESQPRDDELFVFGGT